MDAGGEGQDRRREHGAAGERRGYRAPDRESSAAALRLAPPLRELKGEGKARYPLRVALSGGARGGRASRSSVRIGRRSNAVHCACGYHSPARLANDVS